MRAFLFGLGVLGLLAACDTRAQPAAASGGGTVIPPERRSKELESCSTTADCGEEHLRCYENACRSSDRKIQGDYMAALGAVAYSAGELEASLGHYAEAVRFYEGKPPIDIDCHYGAALAAARADKEKAELAARVLHRCVNAAPAGSELYEAALQQLALLAEAGFDSVHLSKAEPADVYLSRAPSRPKTDELAVSVKATPEPTGKTWAPAAAAIAAARDRLVACWEAAKQPSLSVAVPLASKYHDSGYDDEPGYYSVEIDPKVPPPASESERCVVDVVVDVTKGVKGGGGSWTASVVVTVQ